MSLPRRPYAYSKVENEDPEEKAHRQAQFLIYKVLEQVDLQLLPRQRRPPFSLRVRIRKVKVRIGKRLKILRKNMLVSISAAKINLYRKIMAQLKSLKGLLCGGETAMVNLPAPMLTKVSTSSSSLCYFMGSP